MGPLNTGNDKFPGRVRVKKVQTWLSSFIEPPLYEISIHCAHFVCHLKTLVVFLNKYFIPHFPEQETRVLRSMTRVRTEHGFVDMIGGLSSDPHSNNVQICKTFS